MKLIYYFIMLLAVSSCANNTNVNDYGLELEQATLRPSLTYSYASTSGIHLANYSDPQSTLIDISNGRIVEFNHKTGKQLTSYEIPTEGKYKIESVSDFDGVVKYKGLYYYVSHFAGTIYTIDPESNVIEDILTIDKWQTGVFASSYSNPLLLVDGVIYVTLMSKPLGRKSDRGAILAYDIESRSSSEVFNFPKIYDDDFYGSISYLYWSTVTYCNWRNTFIVSYPLADTLYEYDRDYQLVATHSAHHSQVSGIQPFVEGPIDTNLEIPWKKDREYYDKLSHYDGVYVDAQQKMITRLARIHYEDENGNDRYQYSIVVLNGKLDRIHQSKLDEGLLPFNIYSDLAGIYVLNENEITSDLQGDLPYYRMKVKRVD